VTPYVGDIAIERLRPVDVQQSQLVGHRRPRNAARRLGVQFPQRVPVDRERHAGPALDPEARALKLTLPYPFGSGAVAAIVTLP
jgi:hypothetical protein